MRMVVSDTLYWCLLSMFEPSGQAYRDKLEEAMNKMHEFFSPRQNSPRKNVQAYKGKLAECITLQVQLRYSQTVWKIAAAA